MGKDSLPNLVFGGSGKNWIRIGDVVVNNSDEGWNSVSDTFDYVVVIIMTIVGGICLFAGLIPLAIPLLILGIWSLCSYKAMQWITNILYFLIIIGVIIAFFVLIS